MDVLAFGCRDGATCADHRPEHGALHTAQQTANHTAHTGARASSADLVANAAALEDLCGHPANRVAAAAHRDLVERQRQTSDALETPRPFDGGDDPAHDR